MAVGAVVFAEPIIVLVYGSDFANSVLILRILLISFLAQCIDICTSLMLKATGKQRMDVLLFAFNPLSMILLNLALIPAFGAVGAAYSAVCSVFVSLGLRYYYLSGRLTDFRWRRLLIPSLAFGSVVAPGSWFLKDTAPMVVSLILYLSASALFVLMTAHVSPSDILETLRRAVTKKSARAGERRPTNALSSTPMEPQAQPGEDKGY